MADNPEEITVTRNDAESRYEVHVDGVRGGFTDFAPDSDGRLVFPNTQIDPAFKGRGLGSTLVTEAMADAAQRGDTIVPQCSFVAHYVKEHDVPGLTVHWPHEDDAPSVIE